jgi:hypothetical protein
MVADNIGALLVETSQENRSDADIYIQAKTFDTN